MIFRCIPCTGCCFRIDYTAEEGRLVQLTIYDVTHSDKRETKSLERSPENWRKYRLEAIDLINLLFLVFSNCRVYSHILTVHSRFRYIDEFKTDFK